MKKIIHVLTIKTPREAVYQAITTADGLASWWSKQVAAETKVGGAVDFQFLSGFNPDMEITALDRPGLLRWRCVGGHDPWLDNAFEFRLTEVDEGTRLTFVQDYARELSDTQYGTYNFNWGFYLESLRQYCEEGTGKPYDPERGRSG